jgi:hypothetical protein
MSSTEINPSTMHTEFARGVRAELTTIGTKRSRLQRNQRRTRTLAVGLGALALVGATTGAAIVINSLPGTTSVEALGNTVTVTHTGSASIDLGTAPADATVVIVDLACVSDSGQVGLQTVPAEHGGGPAGISMRCGIANGTRIDDGLLPAAGSTSIDIVADEGTTWTATAQYGSSETTAWGTNANGQTYGVPNVHGSPDLTPALATNGNQGYLFATDLLSADADSSINVYESDGETVVGEFRIGSTPDIPVDETLIPTLPLW